MTLLCRITHFYLKIQNAKTDYDIAAQFKTVNRDSIMFQSFFPFLYR